MILILETFRYFCFLEKQGHIWELRITMLFHTQSWDFEH